MEEEQIVRQDNDLSKPGRSIGWLDEFAMHDRGNVKHKIVGEAGYGIIDDCNGSSESTAPLSRC